MDNQSNSHRNSKQTSFASSSGSLVENTSKSRKNKTEKLLRVFNLVALCAATTLVGAFLFLYLRTLQKQKQSFKDKTYPQVKSLEFGKEIKVTGYSGEYLIVNVKCEQYCSCLLYTERTAFGNADYQSFWEIASESKASNIQIYHIEKSVSNIHEPGAFLALFGSSFYKYQLSCAQRSSDDLVYTGETTEKGGVTVFSPIQTYSEEILFKNITENIIERSRFIYNLKTNPTNTESNKVGKITSNIIPKRFKQILRLKVRETTPLVDEDEKVETDAEKTEDEEVEEDTTPKAEPAITDDTTVNLGNSSLFNVQLVYKAKTPSIIKLTGWIPKSLHLICVIVKQKEEYKDKLFYANDSKFEITKKSPQFNSFDVATYTRSAPNEVIIVGRKADTFLDLNNASPTKFILKLVGVAPGKHELSCGVSNIDRFESLEFTSANYKTTINWLKVLEADINMPNTVAKNEEVQSPKQIEGMSTDPKIFEWFLNAGFEDLYLLFDTKVLKKEGVDGLEKAASKFLGLIKKSLSKSDNTARKEDGQVARNDSFYIHKVIKGIMKNIKVIVNGNLFKKTDLDKFYHEINKQLTASNANKKAYVLNVEMKLLVMLKIMKSLSLLSTVPMDYLADMNFKYYGLWRNIKQNTMTVAMYGSNNEEKIDLYLKDYVFNLLRLQAILIRADLFSEREEMVKETIRDMNMEIMNLLGCNEDGMKVFKTCKSTNLIKKGIEKVIKEKLANFSTHDLLNIDINHSELGIW